MIILTKDTRDFIPDSQKDAETPVVFKLIPPTRAVVLQGTALLQKAIIKAGITATPSEDSTIGESNEEIMAFIENQLEYGELLLDNCVVGWENVVDENSNPIPFSKEMFRKFNDRQILQELTTELMNLKSLSEKK